MRPFRGVWLGRPVQACRRSREAFFIGFQRTVKFFLLPQQRYISVHQHANLLYLIYMERKKPGPQKGHKHTSVVRSTLGDRIYKIRRTRGLTQAQLGTQVGLSKRMIAHYEAGSKAMTVTALQKVASALGVTVATLMGERAAPPAPVNTTKPSVRKRVEILQKLAPTDQQAIFRMIDNAAKNGT